jgi:hypothetical protein
VLGTLYSRIFTFGTDQPVYPPWYMDDNPASGEGFEAAVAYAVAAKMNYANQDVRWIRVPFNAALAPGPKTFDANLSEFSITDQRKAAVPAGLAGRPRGQRRARLHRSVPGVLVDARRRTGGRTRRGRHAVLAQAMRETAVTGRRDRGRRLLGRRRVRRARGKESRREQSRGHRFRPH